MPSSPQHSTVFRFSCASAIVALLQACSGGGSGGDLAPPPTSANLSPVTGSDFAVTSAERAVAVDVLANDSDPDGDALTVLVVDKPANGSAELTGAGVITYLPADGFTGTDTFTYTVGDSRSGRATGHVSVTVRTATSKATNDVAQTQVGQSISIDVLANDTGVGIDSALIASVAAPLYGSVVLDDRGTADGADDYLVYTPPDGFTGADSLIYTLDNGDRAIVEITVTDSPEVPVAEAIPGTLMKGPVANATVRAYATGPGGFPVGDVVAQAVTDSDGSFRLQVPLPRRGLIVVSEGGSFTDESRAQEADERRRVTFGDGQGLEGHLAASATRLDINPITNALLVRARRHAVGTTFAERFARSQSDFAAALGFDALNTRPEAPESPDPAAPADARRYAMLLGGTANSIGVASVALGQRVMDFATITAIVRDLSDCWLDGRDPGGPVSVLRDGIEIALPDDINLETQTLRFRNNNIGWYGDLAPTTVDASACAESVPAPPPPANASPTAVTLSANRLDENAAPETVIGTFTTTDPDAGDAHTYTLVDGPGATGNGDFRIVGATLYSRAVADFEAQSRYSIRVRTDDGVSTPLERTFTVDVNDLNEAPTGLTLSGTNIAENAAPGTTVGTLATNDPDASDTHVYTLVAGAGDSGNASFSISGATLRSAVTFDFETQAIYSIRVRTADAAGARHERAFTITVADVDEAPAEISLSSSAIDENRPAGTAIGTLTSTLGTDDVNYSFVGGAGDADNASFSLDGSTLRSAAAFDYESQGALSLRVRAINDEGGAVERAFVVTVNDVNESPTAIALSATSIDEELAAGAAVGTLSTTDVDAGDTHSYALVAGAGDSGNGSFTVSGDTLRSATSFDFETQASYSIRVRSDDGVSAPYEQVFAITIVDVNEAPTAIALSASALDENRPVATNVGNFTSTDPDAGDSHTYTLVAGAGDSGNGSFTITGDKLQSAASFDFEAQSSYSIRVRTDDGVTTPYAQVFAITVNDVNETPTPAADAALTPTDVPVAINVLLNDNDPDGDALSLVSVTSPANGTATINDNGTPANAADDFIDYTPAPSYAGPDSFDYTVSDGALSATGTVNVSVDDFGYVGSITPADGASSIGVDSNVTIVFNQPMDATTLDSSTLVVSLNNNGSPAEPATVSYDPGTLTATIDPASSLTAGTLYYVIVSNLIENAADEKQGFKVKTSFTTTADPNDDDSDGLTNADEAAMPCLDPANPDTDGDGVGDGAEVAGGGDPCVDQGQSVFYVDVNGGAGGHPDWSAAPPSLSAAYAAGASPTNPNYVLIASGTYLDQLNLTGCANLVFAGSQDTTTPGVIAHNADGSPTTTIDMEAARNSELNNCTDVTVRDIRFHNGTGNGGTKGGGIRVSGTSTVSFTGVYFTGSSVADQGGGLGVSNTSTATVTNSVLSGNTVTAGKGGGGAWVGANATLNISDSLVIDNVSAGIGGGGLYFDPQSTGNISGVTIVGNTAALGGGIYVLNNTGTKDTVIDVDGATIAANRASADGGGLYFLGIGAGASQFDVSNTRITDNYASGAGGAVYLGSVGGIAVVDNNLMIGNGSGTGGGAIHVVGTSTPLLANNTVLYNRTAVPAGGAVDATGGASPVVRDNIAWSNRAGWRALSAPVAAGDNYSPGVVNSDFNVLEVDKVGPSDLDSVTDGILPGFDAGFYLDQATSPAVDSGSTAAALVGLDSAFTAASGPADSGAVDRGFHFAATADYPATGYVEVGGAVNDDLTVTDADTGAAAVELLIRPLAGGQALGAGHLVVASLPGPNAALAQLRDTATTDPLSDGESVLMADLGDGSYRAYVEAQGAAGGPVTIPVEVHVDGVALPVTFSIDRTP